jgi:DNA mismatch repair protein MutL
VHRTFLLAETEQGFLVVDQHAAHERVMFEALMQNLASESPERQQLLVESILEVPPRQAELLTRSLPLLAKVGFEIEPFGEHSFLVRTSPVALGHEDPVTFLAAFLDEQEAGKLSTNLDRHPEVVAALTACKRKSVKAHESLSPESIRMLLQRLAQCENPFSCPHGRPTVIQHTLPELSRQFKRT